jgi:hypothetical protein
MTTGRTALLPIATAAGGTVAVVLRWRAAVLAQLRSDAVLVARLGAAERIMRRPRRLGPARPLVTYFDFGTRPDPTVPLLDRSLQVDVWAVEEAEAQQIGAEVARVLHNRPVSVPGTLRGVYAQLIADRDEVDAEGNQARVVQEYRMLAYDLTT